jgi:tRNA1Val (adenine37-N6)-methyltransferase
MNEDYQQPEFYRFNEDSIRLVKWIVEKKYNPQSVLDLGAGCGVIGIELARALNPEVLTLIDVQTVFLTFMEKNCQTFVPSSTQYSVYITSFSDFSPQRKYDLIVCNPPYYLPGRGEVSKDPNRSIARTFLRDSWPVLLKTISDSLADNGRAFIVLKNEKSLLLEISKIVLIYDLSLESNQRDSIMILELFRLNKN